MDLNRLTTRAQEAIASAVERARVFGNSELTTLHLLQALVADDESVASSLLRTAGVDPEPLRATVAAELARLPRMTGATAQPTATSAFQKALDRAQDEASGLNDEYVATEHLLLALIGERGRPAEILQAGGSGARPSWKPCATCVGASG